MKRLLPLLFVSCMAITSDVQYAAQQPFVTKVQYWIGPGINKDVANNGAKLMSKMGFTFVRVVNKIDAKIFVTLRHCNDPKLKAHTSFCGITYLCDQYKQEPVTFAHEFSHGLGVNHIEMGPAIMNAETDMDDFTIYDVEAFDTRGPGINDPECPAVWQQQ